MVQSTLGPTKKLVQTAVLIVLFKSITALIFSLTVNQLALFLKTSNMEGLMPFLPILLCFCSQMSLCMWLLESGTDFAALPETVFPRSQ